MKKTAALIVSLFLLMNAADGLAKASFLPREAYGAVEDGVYMNTYLGFGFRGDGWDFLTEEVRNDNVAFAERAFGLYSLQPEKDASSAIIMSANLSGYADTVSVTAYDLGEAAAYYEMLGEDCFMESGFDAFRESLEATCEVRSLTLSSVDVSGWEMTCYQAEFSISNTFFSVNTALIRTCFFAEGCLVIIDSSASTMEMAKEALGRLFWL